MCYLPRSNLIAIGIDLGKVYFFDLKKSKYLKNDYQKYFFHTASVKVIINAFTNEERMGKDHHEEKRVYSQDESKGKEILLTSGYDGLILVWEIEAIELKISSKTNELAKVENLKKNNKEFNSLVNNQVSLTPELIEKLSPAELNYLYKIYLNDDKPQVESKNDLGNDFTSDHQDDTVTLKNDFNSKNFSFIPNIKFVINTKAKKLQNHLDDCDLLEIYTMAYLPSKHVVYSGGQDCRIHIWNVINGDLKQTLKVTFF